MLWRNIIMFTHLHVHVVNYNF